MVPVGLRGGYPPRGWAAASAGRLRRLLPVAAAAAVGAVVVDRELVRRGVGPAVGDLDEVVDLVGVGVAAPVAHAVVGPEDALVVGLLA